QRPDLVSCGAALVWRSAMARPHRQRPLEACQGLFELLHRMKREPTIVERLGVVRPHRQGLVETCKGLIVPLQVTKGEAAVVERYGVVRPHRQRPLEACQGVADASQVTGRVAPRLESVSAWSGRSASARPYGES